MQCPKCGFTRQKDDLLTPEGQCPSCGVIYAKAVVKTEAPVYFTQRPYTPRSAAPEVDHSLVSKVFIGLALLIGAGITLAINNPQWFLERYFKEELNERRQQNQQPQDYSRAQITMYSLTTCGFCAAMRDNLKVRGVPFQEVFLDTDPGAMQALTEKLQASGFMGGGIGTPTLEVNGKMMMNNPPLAEVLKQALRTSG
jgi:glutaredoxin